MDFASFEMSNNRKKSKSGGFQGMDLNPAVFKAIMKKGYKLPTPIQRKCIPPILDGKDLVGMARTGSGKTAAFVIPLIHRLRSHSAKVGIRGIILSPSRELALQTQKFTQDMCKYTDLRHCAIVGGDSMNEQYNMLAANPDIIVATPGRFLHLMVETKLDLKMVEYIVFDEADRLFEMGFSVQLHEILTRLPSTRQTLLFSATLPQSLVEFAKAGLQDPELIRLDVDTKISSDLEMTFFHLKSHEKDAALLYLLREVIKLPMVTQDQRTQEAREFAATMAKARKLGENQQTIVFVATKHHVEFTAQLLTEAGFRVSYIYGALDQTARKIQINNFRVGRTAVLVVTDVAARGIDIPVLQNVINFDFVDNSKTFIHRVGRVARAGQRGWAFSFVTNDELPYVIDLQLFLGRPLVVGPTGPADSMDYTKDVVVGRIPLELLESDIEWVNKKLADTSTLVDQQRVAANGYKLFKKTKQTAAPESHKRTKEILQSPEMQEIHPLLVPYLPSGERERLEMVSAITNFRPVETVFEVGQRGTKNVSPATLIMRKRRSQLTQVITEVRQKKTEAMSRFQEKKRAAVFDSDSEESDGEQANESGLAPSSALQPAAAATTTKKSFRDEEYYMSHYQKDANTEKGYAVKKNGASFLEQAQSAVFDLNADDNSDMLKKQNALRWDTKKKKFVRGIGLGSDNKKMLRTESGARIPASYASGSYTEWQSKHRMSIPRTGESELNGHQMPAKKFRHQGGTPAADAEGGADGGRPRSSMGQQAGRRNQSELKSAEQIAKERRVANKKRERSARPNNKKRK
ncbi:P-loop containing nucleoside triphosphate hydrolase protein [Dimargaris cristalligena]|uniref:RNA helicase n=1 Tax=Dimargaris cristalligena TaxID=215637 RepID=A0A4P9ZUT9_9FUNG|nr:P-loop containing nucleoside triphosphate hydrolase protein [Dimargaris cristalligena]|eukprot:RKP36671.1 P-loop containing nucleoside triphosphate hydrolase protein [Dimargaris cristalligena]